jgi:hypothetical protein
MQELTSVSIWTEAGLMKLDAGLGFEVGWNVLLLNKLVVAVCK